MSDLGSVLWPSDRIIDAIAALAGTGADRDQLDGWLPEFRHKLRSAAPVVIVDGEGVLAVERGGRWRSVIAGADGARHRVSNARIERRVFEPAERAAREEIAPLVAAVNGDERLARSLVAAQLHHQPLTGVFAVRPGPGATRREVLRPMRIGRRLVAFVAAQLVSYGLFVASWAVLGRAAFAGDVDGGAVARWGGLLASSVALRAVATSLEGSIGLAVGRVLRQRAVTGALRLDPDDIRHQGVGRLTGTVLESEVVEDLVVGGGLLAIVATAELVVAALVFATAPPTRLLAALLAAWVIVAALLGRSYSSARGAWTDRRTTMTDHLVELVIGHRTRLAQCPPEHWHDDEGALLDAYAAASKRMDVRTTLLQGVVPRAWMLMSLGLLFRADATSTEVTVAFGGILLGFEALQRIVAASAQLADSAVAVSRIAPFVRAAARPVVAPEASAVTSSPSAGDADLAAINLAYAHKEAAGPVLRNCHLSLPVGARVVLEGASGAGKSTLAAVLAGIREPVSGTVLLGGQRIDQIGEFEWRRRVSLSPQFHENHLLSGSFAFNVLMGRGWPPAPGDLELAETVCLAIGLGPLLERMPSGLAEMIGDTGWQLSQGERSLVFVARSLLQDADVVLLDESFGSLDPETFGLALAAVVERARSLVVIRQ
jgi:ATP-binding cassette subfamily B protein